jgi:hypothetical protein
MAEVLVGTNSPVSHQVYWQGEVVDSDSAPTVKVYDITEDPAISPSINPATLLTTLTSVKDETNIGIYNVYLPLSYSNRPRKLKLLWEYQVSMNNVSKEHIVFIVQPYTDLSQASMSLGISTDPSDPMYKSFKDLQAAERYARKKIEVHCGQKFYLYDDSFTVYGNDSDTLLLPQKLNDLHEVYANDLLMYDKFASLNNFGYQIDVTVSGFALKLNRAAMLDNITYTANGMVPPSIHDYTGVFRQPDQYKIQGRFGWEDVPDEVELACIELMKDYFSQDKTWRHKYLKNIQTFDWQFEYNSEVYSGTGNAYADQLLADYVLNQAVII